MDGHGPAGGPLTLAASTSSNVTVTSHLHGREIPHAIRRRVPVTTTFFLVLVDPSSFPPPTFTDSPSPTPFTHRQHEGRHFLHPRWSRRDHLIPGLPGQHSVRFFCRFSPLTSCAQFNATFQLGPRGVCAYPDYMDWWYW